MRSGALGIPHSSRVPEAKSIPDKLHQSAFWADQWSGIDTITEIFVEAKNWYTVDRNVAGGVEAALVIEMDEPTNVTHMGLLCDNSFSNPRPTEALYLDYSHDGSNWEAVQTEASTLSAFYSSSAADNLGVYVWIPRTSIRATFWRLRVPAAIFSSAYLDDTWHISQVKVGTMDHLTDVVFNMNHTKVQDPIEYSSNASYPPAMRPWVDVCRYIHTGIRVDLLFFVRTSDGLKLASFFTDDARLQQVMGYAEGEVYEDYKRTLSILTNSGFMLGVGDISRDAADQWDANHMYAISGSKYYDRYNAFGISSDPKLGAFVTRDTTHSEIKHGLGVDPVVIFGINENLEYITHPDIPGVILHCASTDAEYPMSYSKDSVYIDQVVLSSLSPDAAGLAILALTPDAIATGTYTGTGAAGNAIPTGLGKTPRMMLFMVKAGVKIVYQTMRDRRVYSMQSGTYYGQDVDIDGDVCTILVTDNYINSSGVDYVWWAFA